MYQHCLRILDETGQSNTLQAAYLLADFGHLMARKSAYDRAEELIKRGMTRFTELSGPDSSPVAGCLEKLGGLYVAKGRNDQAEEAYLRAAEILAGRREHEGPDLARVMESLAQIAAETGRVDEAAARFDQARKGRRRYLAINLPRMPYKQQLAFLGFDDEWSFHKALSLGLRSRNDPRMAALSAGWVINGKAVAQEALAESTRRARGDGPVAEVAGRLRDVQSRLAALAQTPASTPDALAAIDRQVAELADDQRRTHHQDLAAYAGSKKCRALDRTRGGTRCDPRRRGPDRVRRL